MLARLFCVLALFCLPLALAAQSSGSVPYQIYGGVSYFSNSFNAVQGGHHPLPGWDTAVSFPAWHDLRFKIDVSGYSGNNLGAPQHVFFIMGGAQYERLVARERFFAHALFGDGGFNRNWGPNGALAGTASFSALLGGGMDTPLSQHIGIRVEGDYQHTNLALIQSEADPVPYRIPGLPNSFGRIATGVVWTPRAYASNYIASTTGGGPKEPVESEVAFEARSSFGHYHIFAGTWWSYLWLAGVEYDRHSWGRFIGARTDYVAEFLPVVILRQPTTTDVFGDPLAPGHETVNGLGISPLGVRMIWRDGKAWKPFFIAKGGMIGFTQKALSKYASYENFTLQQSTGIQFRLNDRWDARVGVSDFHFSNGFLVPSNPGIDEMMYDVVLCYHLGKRERE
jgi:hypothetical protein